MQPGKAEGKHNISEVRFKPDRISRWILLHKSAIWRHEMISKATVKISFKYSNSSQIGTGILQIFAILCMICPEEWEKFHFMLFLLASPPPPAAPW